MGTLLAFPFADAVAEPATALSSAEGWAVLLGIITPLLISVLNQPRYSDATRRVLAIAVAVAVGVVNLLVQGLLDISTITWANALSSLVLVIGASQAAFALLWKPTGASTKVENATQYESKHAA